MSLDAEKLNHDEQDVAAAEELIECEWPMETYPYNTRQYATRSRHRIHTELQTSLGMVLLLAVILAWTLGPRHHTGPTVVVASAAFIIASLARMAEGIQVLVAFERSPFAFGFVDDIEKDLEEQRKMDAEADVKMRRRVRHLWIVASVSYTALCTGIVLSLI
ncbi:hypothetical protein RQP46_010212 [Phenoliferia psychrophenolica]